MAELGLIASVIQVADVGIRLSVTLYKFGQTVVSADDSIVFISKDISHTCSILKTIGQNLEKDHEAQLYSQDAMNTAETIVKECLEIFHEMDRALLKKIKRIGLDGSSSRAAVVALERLKWPFLRPKMMLLWSNLDKLKSSLDLLLNVFIYARHLTERTEEPSVVNNQRRLIEHLLHTTTEQTRKYESLKAAMDRQENLDIAHDSTNDIIPATPDLDAAIPTKLPNKSKTIKLLEDTGLDPGTASLENYFTLIEHLMTEVEAKEYNIGHDMRRRIRDDVIHTHKRETKLLRAVHGHTALKEKMRENSSILAEMVEEKVEEGGHSQIEQPVESSSGAKFARIGDSSPQILGSNPSHSPQEGVTRKQVKGYEGPPDNIRMTTMDRVYASTINPVMQFFLNNREDSWNPLDLGSEAPMVESPRAAEENGWVPFCISGPSRLLYRRILPLKPLKPYIQNEHMPQWSFLRSGTSMLVTEKSHIVESIASSQDLAALTDSTDTDTFVSARSVIGERALDSNSFCPVEDEKDGPLVVLGDQEHGDFRGKDGGQFALDPSLDGLLAAWVNGI